MNRKPIYGLMAEFETPEKILEAALRTHAAGYRRIDAFTPIPVEGLAEAVGFDLLITTDPVSGMSRTSPAGELPLSRWQAVRYGRGSCCTSRTSEPLSRA